MIVPRCGRQPAHQPPDVSGARRERVYSTGIAVTIQLGSIDCLRLTASYDHEIVSSIATRPIQGRIVAARRAAKSLAVTLLDHSKAFEELPIERDRP